MTGTPNAAISKSEFFSRELVETVMMLFQFNVDATPSSTLNREQLQNFLHGYIAHIRD
jgi:hypothetical protein